LEQVRYDARADGQTGRTANARQESHDEEAGHVGRKRAAQIEGTEKDVGAAEYDASAEDLAERGEKKRTNLGMYCQHWKGKCRYWWLTANPSTKILMEKEPSILDSLSKSLFTKGRAGAKMEDAKGLRKVMELMRPMMNHFLLSEKFLCVLFSIRFRHEPMEH